MGELRGCRGRLAGAVGTLRVPWAPCECCGRFAGAVGELRSAHASNVKRLFRNSKDRRIRISARFSRPEASSMQEGWSIMDRFARLHRKSLNVPGHAHELTFCCHRRLPLLDRDRTREWLVASLNRARQRHDFMLWAYVIMPNHVHLLIKPRSEEYRIAAILSSIKQPVARQAFLYLRRETPTFLSRLTVRRASGRIEQRFWLRGGGYDRDIVGPKALEATIDYIHANPVRAGLAKVPTDWGWSSARWYAGWNDVNLMPDELVF